MNFVKARPGSEPHVSPFFSSPDTHECAYGKREKRRSYVIALTTAATATSFAITAVGPDDSGTPIADQLMAIAKDFAFVLAAIVLEKYLMTLMGTACFAGAISLCRLIFAVAGFLDAKSTRRQSLRSGAAKLMAVGIVHLLTIPISVNIASIIDKTYQGPIDALTLTPTRSAEWQSRPTKGSVQTIAIRAHQASRWRMRTSSTRSAGEAPELSTPSARPSQAPQQVLVTTDSTTARLAPAAQPRAIETRQAPSNEDTAADEQL